MFSRFFKASGTDTRQADLDDMVDTALSLPRGKPYDPKVIPSDQEAKDNPAPPEAGPVILHKGLPGWNK